MKFERVLELFREISCIPRGPENPVGISGFVHDFAIEAGCGAVVDNSYNVFVRKPAATGMEDYPTLVFQAHMDMVCVSDPEVSHDFGKMPIPVQVGDDGWLFAEGTTLGADDGLGMALMLGLIESGEPCGCLEFVFTTEEETNMHGAKTFDYSQLSGKYIINLDNEEELSVIVSSSGIMDLRMYFDAANVREECHTSGRSLYQLNVGGFRGGHSGMDIVLPRLNAIKIMGDILSEILLLGDPGFEIYRLNGGSHMNAIPTAAECVFSVGDSFVEQVGTIVDLYQKKCAVTEKKGIVRMLAYAGDIPTMKYTEVGLPTALRMIKNAPHGVISRDPEESAMVETSLNLARILETSERTEIWFCYRSSSDQSLLRNKAQTEALAEQAGGHVECVFMEFGWPRNRESRLTPYIVRMYDKVLNEVPRVESIHAGLECGCFARNVPDADIVSIGPTLVHPHTTGERADLSSLEHFVWLLDAVVRHADTLKDM